MTAKTPGQHAFEAMHADCYASGVPCMTWDELADDIHENWERAAKAVIHADRTAQRERLAGRVAKLERRPAREPVPELGAVAYEAAENAPLRARIRHFEAAITALADLWVREADEGDAAKSSLGFDGIATEARQMRRVHAAALRKILGGES